MTLQARRFDPKKRQGLVSTERHAKWDPLRFLARLDLQAGQTVLDLGCGPGFWTLPLAELVGPAGTVWALDVSQEMLDALTARRPPPQVRLLRCELPVIALPDASVDWVWVAFVFHEVEPPEKLAAEMRRVTRIGGRVTILDWRPDAESDHLRVAGFQDVVRTWQDEDACLIEARGGGEGQSQRRPAAGASGLVTSERW
jgi:ubiquinone/menaquinone biosynthesis C-methylase UbiE